MGLETLNQEAPVFSLSLSTVPESIVTFHLWVSVSRHTYGVNHHVLFEVKHVDSFVGDCHADEEPLVLGPHHHRVCGLRRAERVNKLQFLDW